MHSCIHLNAAYMFRVRLDNRFENLGFDHHHTERPEHEHVRVHVFTNKIGKASKHTYINAHTFKKKVRLQDLI